MDPNEINMNKLIQEAESLNEELHCKHVRFGALVFDKILRFIVSFV